MPPSNTDPPGHVRSVRRATSQPTRHALNNLQPSAPAGMRPRSDDSWIEVSSQPSSSSMSSANDEIITTGLRVQHDSNARRRRHQRAAGRPQLDPGYRGSSAGTSSQEEYDESESESDRVLSSNEGLPRSPLHQEVRRISRAPSSSASFDGGDDEDENATAVGYIRNADQSFTPQPNAFTHPPAYRQHQPQTSYFERARPAARTSNQRHSYPSQQQHTPYNMISPSHQVDHDAALRASLSTLLSCAAAARGLPKSSQQQSSARTAAPSSSRVDPSTLRMVPESALPSALPSPPAPSTNPPTGLSRNTGAPGGTPSSATPLSPGTDKHKRRRSRDRRGSTKKARRVHSASSAVLDESTPSLGQVSPTLLTWVVSAGVVVLVSALSFSAGYVVGRDAARAEVEMLGELGNVSNVGSCAGEVVGRTGGGPGLGLRRLRFADAVRV